MFARLSANKVRSVSAVVARFSLAANFWAGTTVQHAPLIQGSTRMSRAIFRRVPGLFLLLLAVLFTACGRTPDTKLTGDTSASSYLNFSPEATNVGKETCKSCHPAQYETYIKAQMGRSFKPATLSASAANFDHPAPVYDGIKNLYYQAFHRGQDLFMREYRLAGPDTIFSRVEQIDFIIGSGQHTNSHMMEVNGYFYQMPMTWYAQEGIWDLPPKFRGGNSKRFSRPIPVACMSCHNGLPDFVPGSENRYTKVPSGIDCERCHGPGSIHVAEKKAGHLVDVSKEIDYTIVNPAKLPPDLQLDVCRRCHMQGAAVWKGKSPTDFRPGMKLSDFENVYWPRFPDSTTHFIMASHPDRLAMSQCFRQSHAGAAAPMTCLTCHNPHLPIETVDVDHFRQACLACHTPEKNNLCTAPDASRQAKGDNCVTCHMPTSGSIDIPHVRITDHYIRIPGAAPLLSHEARTKTQNVVRIASLLDETPSFRDKADGYLTYYSEMTNNPVMLDSAAMYLEKARRKFSDKVLAPSLVRLWFWQKNYAAIRKLAASFKEGELDDAWTFYRIGEAFLSAGQTRPAVQYFEGAVKREPQQLRFLNKLGTAYSRNGKIEKALATFDRILQANPKFDDAYNNRGFVRVMKRDFAGAEADFKAALQLNPDAVLALANLASLYFNTNRQAESRPLVQRLLEIDPNDQEYIQFMNILNGPVGGG